MTAEEERNIAVVNRVFETTCKLDASAIDELFSSDFQMYSNDVNWNFQEYKDFHIESFKQRKAIDINCQDIFCKDDKVSARATIKLTDQNNVSQEIQIILIAQIVDGKISRLWELTFPHWQ